MRRNNKNTWSNKAYSLNAKVLRQLLVMIKFDALPFSGKVDVESYGTSGCECDVTVLSSYRYDLTLIPTMEGEARNVIT